MSDPTYPTTSSFPGSVGSTGNPSGAPGSTSTGVRDKITGVTSQARDKAAELGRNAADTLDRNLENAASKLQNTADTLRSKAGMGTDKVSQLAGTAADKLDATARYFQNHQTRDMLSDLEQVIRRNPGASLGAALAVGFLIGTAMKKDRY
ncbi:MAG TPA: hypothetical protein VEQ63_02960 [Bryobacteraceae bacterium]|nr:hypothetical protein [Bryobacteraceae bacterium]